MEVRIYQSLMTTRREAHEHLAEQLGFPEYYGKNLDALHDLLTERGEDTEIIVEGSEVLAEAMNGYGKRIINVLLAAARYNEHLKVTLE